MRPALLLSTAALLTGTAAPAAKAPAQPLQLTCAGPFRAAMTEARLRARFGAGNVVRGTAYAGEGTTVPATVIYPRDPARTLEVLEPAGSQMRCTNYLGRSAREAKMM